MANIIQQALQRLMPQKILSPLPPDQTLNNPFNMGIAQQTQTDLSQFWPAIIKKLKQGEQGGQPTMKDIKSALSQIGGKTQAAQAQVSPTPSPTPAIDPSIPIPTGTSVAMNYIKSQTPGGQDPMKYYKAFQDPNFMPKIQAADQKKPGSGNLLLLQAFNESTLGNSGNDIFGALPGGEGNQAASFATPSQAVDYQLGPNVLGGGGNPNMNIMSDPAPLTVGRVQQLYKSYNPEGAYINPMLKTLTGH